MKKLIFTLISLCMLILGAETVLVNHKDVKMCERQEACAKDYTKENEFVDSLQVDKIMMLYRQMYSAIIERDMDTIGKIFANDFVLLYINGRSMDKNECINAIREGAIIYLHVNHDDIVVTVSGDHATLCGKSFVNVENHGEEKKADLHIQQDMTLEKRNGKWVFTHSTATTY